MRSAPADGYDFGNKRQYRRTIWATFRKSDYWRPDSRALLMPSLEGDEIDVAKRNGFSERNLTIVDRNAAIVATLKRRYPQVKTYGVEVSRACEKMGEREESVTFANLDLCSCFSLELERTLGAFATPGIISAGQVAVTMLRGREHGIANRTIGHMSTPIGCDISGGGANGLTPRDGARIAALAWVLSAPAICDGVPYQLNTALVERAGVYRSSAGTQTMLWAIFDIHRSPCACMTCAKTNFHRTGWTVDEWFERLSVGFGETKKDIIATSLKRLSVKDRRAWRRAGLDASMYPDFLAFLREKMPPRETTENFYEHVRSSPSVYFSYWEPWMAG